MTLSSSSRSTCIGAPGKHFTSIRFSFCLVLTLLQSLSRGAHSPALAFLHWQLPTSRQFMRSSKTQGNLSGLPAHRCLECANHRIEGTDNRGPGSVS